MRSSVSGVMTRAAAERFVGSLSRFFFARLPLFCTAFIPAGLIS